MNIQRWKLKLWKQDKSEAIGKLIMLMGILVGNILNMIFWHSRIISLVCLTINEVILFELLIVWVVRLHNDLAKMRIKNILKKLTERN